METKILPNKLNLTLNSNQKSDLYEFPINTKKITIIVPEESHKIGYSMNSITGEPKGNLKNKTTLDIPGFITIQFSNPYNHDVTFKVEIL
jgi:hypothetical protein